MARSPTVGLFPGTFDPITNGHLDLLVRGQGLFDELVIAVGRNPAKRELFTQEERVAMIRALVAERCDDHVRVEGYPGLTVDFARDVGATAILRGLRNAADLTFEFQLALTNRALVGIETIFMMTSDEYALISSTLIKQIAAGGAIDRLAGLLPERVVERMQAKKAEHGGTLPWAQVDHLKE